MARARGQWYRLHGNEKWEFNTLGYMEQRHASFNDRPITEAEPMFRWPRGRPTPWVERLGL